MTSNLSKEKSYLAPFMIMVGLFFIVGFLTVVNQQFQAPLKDAFLANAGNLQNTFATFITFAFFMGYPAMGGISSNWVDKIGYKGTLSRGLVMLAASLCIFEISAWAGENLGQFNIGQDSTLPFAYIIFFIGSFFLGCSLAVLQVVINPYLVVCKVEGTSEVTRMSIGGSSNSIGTTIAPFFVTALVFQGVTPKIDQLYIPFAVLIAVILLVALLVGKLHLPNIGGSTADNDQPLTQSVWSFRHLTLGVVGIFVYVGAEVCIGANVTMHGTSLGLDGSTMAAFYWGGMLVGRLCGSFLSKIHGKIQLAFTTIIATILILVSIALNNPWILVGVGLFHSIMWGAIFSLAVDKLGKYTAKASGALMIGVAGGAVLPWFQGILSDAIGGWQFTWFIVIFAEVYLLFYALVGHKHNLKEEL